MGVPLSRYAAHVLIFGGLALFTTLIRSAAGPADAVTSARAAAPPERVVAAPDGTPVPLLIPSSQRAVGGPASVPTAALEPTLPVPTPTLPEPTATAEPEPTAAPALPPLPPTDRIVIPRIKLDTKIVDVGVSPSGEMETAAFAVGRLSYGAQAGEAGNVVLAGHDDIQGEVFRRLPELQVGDAFTVYRGDQSFTYRVEIRTIVREDGATEAQRRENAQWMEQTDEPVATLISCYPYRVDTHRIIVRAKLVTA